MIYAGLYLVWATRSVPRAAATASNFGDVLLSVDPVATAPGTDLILNKSDQSCKQLVNRHAPSCEHPGLGHLSFEITPAFPDRLPFILS